MSTHPIRDEAYWDAMVAKQLEGAPPMTQEQARRIVALMWPNGLEASRKKRQAEAS